MTDHPPASDGCAARRRDGQPCRARPRPGRDVCAFHDPDLADARADARTRGGRHKATSERAERRLPASLRGVSRVVTDTLDGVAEGRVEPARGQAVASLARAAVAVYSAGVEDVAERVEDALAAAGNGKAPR